MQARKLWRKWWTVGALVVAAGCGAGISIPEDRPPEPGPEPLPEAVPGCTHTGCADGYVCIGERCQKGCETAGEDGPCGEGYICEGTTPACQLGCRPDEPTACGGPDSAYVCIEKEGETTGVCLPGCTTTCPEGYVCGANNLCEVGCKEHTDCTLSGYSCQEGTCQLGCDEDKDCGEDSAYICKKTNDESPGICQPGCRENEECGDHYVCDATTNTCRPGCAEAEVDDAACGGPGFICQGTPPKCQPGCRKNDECASGYRCDLNANTCKTWCTNHANHRCANGYLCTSRSPSETPAVSDQGECLLADCRVSSTVEGESCPAPAVCVGIQEQDRHELGICRTFCFRQSTGASGILLNCIAGSSCKNADGTAVTTANTVGICF